MILVTGATGNIGAPLVAELLAAGHEIRALVIDLAEAKQKLGDKVELVKGSYTDKAALATALAGVDKVFLLSPPSPDQPQWEANVVDAAKPAGVKHIVKQSVVGAQYESTIFGKWHRASEKKLEQSGIAWTFLRPSALMSNSYMWIGSVKGQGAVYMPCGDGKSSIIDPRDVAAVAAKCLTSSGHENEIYELTGPEGLSMAQQAKALGDALGKPLNYVDVPDAAAKDSMLGMGLPPIIVDAFLEITGFIRSGGAGNANDTVKQITGKPARTFAAWCEDNAGAFR